jgi:hypothetical protein
MARTVALIVDCVLAFTLIVLFFQPWIQLEMVPVTGHHLDQLAIEQYGEDHVMAKIIYALYALPVLAVILITSWAFGYRKLLLPTKLLMLVLAGAAFFIIWQFHSSEDYNIRMRYGVSVSTLCCVLMVANHFLRRRLRTEA